MIGVRGVIMRRTTLLACLFLLVFLAPRPTPAQESEEPSRDLQIRGLISQQESAYQTFQKLEDQMRKLAAALRKSGHEDKALNLERAIEVMVQRDIRRGMQEVRGFLEKERLNDAAREAGAVEEGLGALIAILESRRDQEKIKEDLKRVEEALADVRALKNEQADLREQTREAREAGSESDRMKAAREAVDTLIREQTAIRNQSDAVRQRQDALARARADLESMLREQKELSKETSDAADAAADIGSGLEEVRKALSELSRAQEDAHGKTSAAASTRSGSA